MPLLRVLETGTMIDEEGRTFPTAVIDATDHPEISDLARVHMVEGVGDIRTEAARFVDEGRDMLMLGVRMTRPVVAGFALLFDLENHSEVLFNAADANALVIAHTPPQNAGEEQPAWLAIDLDGLALRMHL